MSIKDWHVSTDYNGSDHNNIIFKIQTEKTTPPPQYQLHKADWDIFATSLNKKPIKIPSETTEVRLEKCLDDYYKSIEYALNKACPKKIPKIKDKNTPWWTRQLQESRRELNRLYRRRTIDSENWLNYKTKEKQYRKTCYKAKTINWQDFLEKQSSLESINKLRKMLEKNVQHSLGTLTKPDGTPTEPGKDTLCLLYTSPSPRDS